MGDEKKKRGLAWTALVLILLLAGTVWYLLRRDVTNAELKADVADAKTEILRRLDDLAAREAANGARLDALAAGQMAIAAGIAENGNRAKANGDKLDRLLKLADRELPDGMKAVE